MVNTLSPFSHKETTHHRFQIAIHFKNNQKDVLLCEIFEHRQNDHFYQTSKSTADIAKDSVLPKQSYKNNEINETNPAKAINP
jgi:hypothetical protein